MASELRLAFGNAAEDYERGRVQDRDGAVADLVSVSVFAALPADERSAMADELRAALPVATYRTPIRTEVSWTRLQ